MALASGPNSRVIRAESDEAEGPYQFAEEILPLFHHNPTVTRAADGTWLMFVIGRAVDSSSVVDCRRGVVSDPAPGNMESNITLLYTDSITAAAWTNAGVAETGNTHLMYRGCGDQCTKGERIGLAIAFDGWNCSVDVAGGCQYERITTDDALWSAIFDSAPSCEDPFLYVMGGETGTRSCIASAETGGSAATARRAMAATSAPMLSQKTASRGPSAMKSHSRPTRPGRTGPPKGSTGASDHNCFLGKTVRHR